jgi:hypothetical protein
MTIDDHGHLHDGQGLHPSTMMRAFVTGDRRVHQRSCAPS